MGRNRARGLGRPAPKRLTEWVRTDASAGGTDYASLAGGAAIIDQTLPGVESETIIRCRGSLNVVSDQAAATEVAFGAYGLCVVSNQAAAIGVTAIPTPYTDADSDLWFVHGYWYAPVRFNSAVGFQNISQTERFDSKAMRRISADETMVMVVENGHATDGVRFSLNVAILIKQG